MVTPAEGNLELWHVGPFRHCLLLQLAGCNNLNHGAPDSPEASLLEAPSNRYPPERFARSIFSQGYLGTSLQLDEPERSQSLPQSKERLCHKHSLPVAVGLVAGRKEQLGSDARNCLAA